MSIHISDELKIDCVELPLERDLFLRTLVRELSGTLEDIIGYEEAAGYISIVGQRVGEWINTEYKQALNIKALNASQVAEVCIDLKKRIQGDFYIIEHNNDKIVFGNRACPFGDKVVGRSSMCMMTSNVFGSIAADNLGYGKVALEKTIAKNDKECRVVLYLNQTDESEQSTGREYFNTDLIKE
ncbi:methanogen output domain 1-containing protein [Flocculibacter collagenilyticus]|uniref:methanogen output domain 1-containing protein n=1 Tax=Flocculibacter collagenilyticus TaxID=2744479 RepID=UPI0018F447FD|nr:methanogen output domain 1-containing protein [Flocculibacter collagenilyticus]